MHARHRFLRGMARCMAWIPLAGFSGAGFATNGSVPWGPPSRVSPRSTGSKAGRGARGISSRFKGSPIAMCSAAQACRAPAELRVKKGGERYWRSQLIEYAGDRSTRHATVEPGGVAKRPTDGSDVRAWRSSSVFRRTSDPKNGATEIPYPCCRSTETR
jgi:hypothetical protein